MNTTYKLSPSDLTFLWDECPRCFYLKVVRNFNRPGLAFPKIFTRIDRLMKEFFYQLPAEEISPALPPGQVAYADKWVYSAPISFPHHSSSCYIRGIFDTVLQFDDQSFAVVDFKTSQPKSEHVAFYSRQLHAYSYALENPHPGKFSLSPITMLGLLCVEPVQMNRTEQGNLAYEGQVTWLECPKDDKTFLEFIDGVLEVLDAPAPPAAHPKCSFCNYRENARQTGY
ncbi:MAG TPA: PD-(D/E)XK nuclease family protein [Anaerolineales bacterium]|nr:PD-(D/E)XK nuclease family protein [Anaerolineales bacterium]